MCQKKRTSFPATKDSLGFELGFFQVDDIHCLQNEKLKNTSALAGRTDGKVSTNSTSEIHCLRLTRLDGS